MLRLALRCLIDADRFRHGIKRVVRVAGDVGSNGAVAGALLEARFGAVSIPEGWLDVLLRRDELLDPL